MSPRSIGAGLWHDGERCSIMGRPGSRSVPPSMRAFGKKTRLVDAILPLTLVFGAAVESAAAPPERRESAAETPRSDPHGASEGSRSGGVLWVPGVRDAAHPGRWSRLMEERRAILKRAGRGPEAVLALLGILGQLEGELPLGELESFLRSVADDTSRDPEVRSFANYQRARLIEDRGRAGEARDLYRAEGYLGDWMIVGAFDYDKDEPLATPLGPELEAFSPDQVFEGKLEGEPLVWRHHSPRESASGALLSLDEFISPNLEVIGYATTWVYVPKRTRAMLTVGTGGPYRAWLDGTLIADADPERSADPLQDAYGIELEAGWHRLLFKLAADESMWGLYARVSDPKGGAIAGLRHSAAPDSGDVPVGAAVADAKAAAETRGEDARRSDKLGLRARLEAKARASGRRGAAAKLGLAEFYRWVRPFDSDDERDIEVARQAEAVLKSLESAYVLAALARDQGEARDALELAISRARAQKGGPAPQLGELLLFGIVR